MRETKKSFRHESLQDADTIQDILKAISKGLGNGSLSFSDEDDSIDMRPEGLLNLKVTASEDDSRHRLDIRVSWQAASPAKKKKALKVGG